jgi:hypothetical protein
MGKSVKPKAKRPANRFYHSAKVSEYQFKRVLWSFVLDRPVAEAAKTIDLSANSIQAIYAKLRVFFTEIGVFRDIYEGGDPRDGTAKGEDYEGFEHMLIPFHIKRVKGKRRTKFTTIDDVDYNWNESFWRFHYWILTEGRPSEAIHRMQYAHLLAQIRLCGPIGLPPRNRERGVELDKHHFNQRLLWLERNSPQFSYEAARAQLRDYRERNATDFDKG